MERKKIIIVVENSPEEEYGRRLGDKIRIKSANYDVIVRYAKNFDERTLAISPLDKIIYFGEARKEKDWEKDKKTRWKFSKFGMRYGWAGNVCTIYASLDDLKWKDYFEEFRNYCENMQRIYRDVPLPHKNLVKAAGNAVAKGERATYRCQYSALIHEFLDWGGFDSFMAEADPRNPAFVKIVQQLPNREEYNAAAAEQGLWNTEETRDGYRLQKGGGYFRILDRESKVIAWGDRSYEKLGEMAFFALFKEPFFKTAEQQKAPEKGKIRYKTLESLEPIDGILKEADKGIKDESRMIRDSGKNAAILVGSFPEVAGCFIGGGIGAVGSFLALYFMGSVIGLSAAGITSALAALGALVGGGMVAGIFVLAVPIAALAGAGAIAVGKINKKKLETEKERLLQQAIEKQNAIMFRIKAEVNAVQERADYLASLNTVLKLIIKDLKADLGK